MLKKIRVVIAGLFFLLITLLFLDFTGSVHVWFGWIAKIQLIPAVLAVNAVILAALVLATLLFGRIYCSVICPLGVFQDLVSRISSRRKGKKNRFSYSPAKSLLRYGILGLFIVSLVAGLSTVVSLLDPYAAYGRMAANFLAPLYRWGNNLLALLAEQIDSYAFYSTEVLVKGWLTFGIALVTLIVTVILAWKHGRSYCNTICPVGTFLGFLSRFSLFRIVIDVNKCTQCKACERGCKSSCIEAHSFSVDHSRCVACFNCIGKCKFGALKYTGARAVKKAAGEAEPPGLSRRNLLSLLGLLAVSATVKAQQLQVDGGLAAIEDKKVPDRKTPIMPPGCESAQHMKQHCTACQLCVSACPNHILVPSRKFSVFMQPEISYERGYCRPECVECSQVCPAGAIRPITPADKSAISIGQAIWIPDNCVVNRDGLPCDSCQRHCPTGAITLIERDPDHPKLKIPVVDKELCIGCGACENLCPARPFSAIYVEGNVRHHSI
ncbi:MAG: 4Fe-4S dicluster domain-containing protein [Culturomica sp.]|jgi:ferredoxin|nr:4Fe-4S dicluster domain-containing protein [Culturomica sp.]